MPAAVRYNDICTGHGCFPARPNDQASSDVFYNNLGAHRIGDHWITHCCGDSCHDSNQSSGSPNVFVNNIAQARVGDSVACGSSNATGSPNVFVNNGGGSPSSSIFNGVVFDRQVALTPAQSQTYARNLANQSKYNTEKNIEDGVAEHPEMEDDPQQPPETVKPSTVNPNCAGSTGGDMGATLDQVLGEAQQGQWKEDGNNPNIEALYSNVGFNNVKGDQTAWCAAFAGSMLKKNCFKYNKSLAAGSYTGYGNPIDIAQAQKGDILVFDRQGGTGHVCFYYGPGPTPGTIYVVGGNQSNNVTKSLRKISDLKPNGVQRPTPS